MDKGTFQEISSVPNLVSAGLSFRCLNFHVQRPILEIRLEEFCRRRYLNAEIVRCANLHLAGAKTIIPRVSSGLFSLPQKMQVKPRRAGERNPAKVPCTLVKTCSA